MTSIQEPVLAAVLAARSWWLSQIKWVSARLKIGYPTNILLVGQGGSATPAFSASFTYTDHVNNVTAVVREGAVVVAGGAVTVNAYVHDLIEVSTKATVDTKKDKKNPRNNKNYSVAVAVLVWKL